MTLKSRFEGDLYRQSRPLYPTSFFDAIRPSIQPGHRTQNFQVLDLGAGTGYAAESFSRVLPSAKLTLLEPDVSMLAEARALMPEGEFLHSTAEFIELQNETVDLILIGSAWHWMDYEKTKSEMLRVLKPGGVIFVFEYQFPKAQLNVPLNEWVRRQFNLSWKAPRQVPRGSLYEITESLRCDVQLSQAAQVNLSEVRPHDADEFARAIFSQSRFLHYEESLPAEDRRNYRLKIENELKADWFAKDTLPFVYLYEGYAFRKRP